MLYRELSRNRPFFITGPCVIENEEVVEEIAEEIHRISQTVKSEFIFKASFDKANRNSIESYRGPGIVKGLEILKKIKERYQLPILTDIHEVWQAEQVAAVADIIQIPAFLCRQTDLVLKAAETGKIVNIKKGQFMSGLSMGNIVRKVESTGNKKILLTERGNSFGYGDLVVDFRNLVDMKTFGYPVVFDATHSVQKPGALGNASGGDRRYIPYLSAAAASLAVDGFFFETHPMPEKALSDGPNMVELKNLGPLIERIIKIHHCAEE